MKMSVQTMDMRKEIAGKVRTGVIIDEVCKEITFLVAERVTPNLIGGIDILRNFGYQPMQKIDSKTNEKNENYICNIEANFGRQIKKGERLKRALNILKIKEDQRLLKIIESKKDVTFFMAIR